MEKRKWSIEEVEEYRKKRNQSFYYYNKSDAHFRVPKARGYGWTINLAHPLSRMIIIVVLMLAIAKPFIKYYVK